MKILKSLLFFSLCFLLTLNSFANTSLPEGIIVRKIWGNEKHNAFTSLIDFKGTLYCAFREGDGHVFGKDGVTRILASRDGINWESVTTLKKKVMIWGPKLSVTSMEVVVIGGSVYNEKVLMSRLARASFSNRAVKILDPSDLNIVGEQIWTGCGRLHGIKTGWSCISVNRQ